MTTHHTKQNSQLRNFVQQVRDYYLLHDGGDSNQPFSMSRSMVAYILDSIPVADVDEMLYELYLQHDILMISEQTVTFSNNFLNRTSERAPLSQAAMTNGQHYLVELRRA